MKTPRQLINNVIGQLNGIKLMMDKKKDCFDVIVQMKAAHSAMGTVLDKYIEDNLSYCINSSRSTKQRSMLKKLVKELIK